MIIEIPTLPIAQKRHRHTFRSSHGHTYDPSVKDKKIVKAFMLKGMKSKDLYLNELSLMITFVFPWPKKWYRTGKYSHLLKDTAPEIHTKKPDIDNLLKLIMDSGNGVVWKDDCQIWEVQMRKIYGDPPKTIIQLEETNE